VSGGLGGGWWVGCQGVPKLAVRCRRPEMQQMQQMQQMHHTHQSTNLLRTLMASDDHLDSIQYTFTYCPPDQDSRLVSTVNPSAFEEQPQNAAL
jgi:hypothetical protein